LTLATSSRIIQAEVRGLVAGEIHMSANKCIAILAVLVTLIVAFWAVVHAADKPGGSAPKPTYAATQGATLRGLKGVEVLVESPQPHVERLGLTAEAVRIDTQLSLRQYGIKVLTHEDAVMTPGRPSLYILVAAAGAANELPAVSGFVLVQVSQSVSLDRDPTVHCLAATWQKESWWTVGRSKVEKVRDLTKDVVSIFINDYLAANPKQPAPNQDDGGSEAK